MQITASAIRGGFLVSLVEYYISKREFDHADLAIQIMRNNQPVLVANQDYKSKEMLKAHFAYLLYPFPAKKILHTISISKLFILLQPP